MYSIYVNQKEKKFDQLDFRRFLERTGTNPPKKHRKTERVSFPKKEEFNFPDAEFGGFVPVRSRNRRKSNWSNFFSF
jgi:hypothetical protein